MVSGVHVISSPHRSPGWTPPVSWTMASHVVSSSARTAGEAGLKGGASQVTAESLPLPRTTVRWYPIEPKDMSMPRCRCPAAVDQLQTLGEQLANPRVGLRTGQQRVQRGW